MKSWKSQIKAKQKLILVAHLYVSYTYCLKVNNYSVVDAFFTFYGPSDCLTYMLLPCVTHKQCMPGFIGRCFFMLLSTQSFLYTSPTVIISSMGNSWFFQHRVLLFFSWLNNATGTVLTVTTRNLNLQCICFKKSPTFSIQSPPWALRQRLCITGPLICIALLKAPKWPTWQGSVYTPTVCYTCGT